ncbi:phage tail tube protein [Roseicella aquatilis]
MRTIRADRKIEGADPGICRATGQVTVRFADTTLLTQAQNGSSADFAPAYTIAANCSLTVTLHEACLALAKTSIEGPGGIEPGRNSAAIWRSNPGLEPSCSTHGEQLSMESRCDRQVMAGEIRPERIAEARRPAEPNAGVPPVRHGLADAVAVQAAVARIVEHVHADARGLRIGPQFGDRLVAVLGGGVEQVYGLP